MCAWTFVIARGGSRVNQTDADTLAYVPCGSAASFGARGAAFCP
jgi:hypothetical protein